MGEGGLVSFVVPVPSVAEKVNNHVALEFLAEIESDLRYRSDRDRILRINMKDGSFDHFCHIGGIQTRPSIGR